MDILYQYYIFCYTCLVISKNTLEKLYLKQGKSKQDIANILNCSLHKVSYWMNKFKMDSRTISEAVYLKNNPTGDPFNFIPPKTLKQAKLFGLGFGLYWGEGTKADTGSVRLGNTDPELIKVFIEFLIRFFSIKKSDLRFSLQLFNDVSVPKALRFWIRRLKVRQSQFSKTTVTISGSIGTYRNKNKFGVITVYYHNKKLRDMLLNMLTNIKIKEVH